MKRLITLLLVLSLALSLTGCKVMDYKTAMDYYEAGEYAQALEIYRSLGDFADSQAMAEICWQKADYKQAEALFAAGDYRQALELYQGLSMYMDSPAKAIVCQYRIGLACIEAGEYEEALSWLEPLGSYEDCPEQVQLAKWQWIYETVKADSPTAEVGGGTIALSADDEGGFSVYFINVDSLLGISYTKNFRLSFGKDSREGIYTAVYDSTSNGQIKEEASGVLDIAQFSAASNIPVDSFTQTVIDPDGKETVSDQTTDALMMEGLLMEMQATLVQCIPELLAQTGLPLTVADIGFAALG